VNLEKGSLLLVPGGVVFALTIVLLHSGVLQGFTPVVNFFYMAAFFLALVLAWRFHSSRVFSAIIVMLFAQQALRLFSDGSIHMSARGQAVFELSSFLVPINFALLAFIRERGFTVHAISTRLLLLGVQSVFVAVMCRPEYAYALQKLFHSAILKYAWLPRTELPQVTLLVGGVVIILLLVRALLWPKPIGAGFVWALISFLMAFHSGTNGTAATLYAAGAAIIFTVSIVETSYAMAYHDELTGLPSRRAFHDAILQLTSSYTIAMVDIDHFKSVNDTYGHDTGDDVLCMVASKLSQVTGGGQVYRVGGEEFCILFPGCSAQEVLPDLENLRALIESSPFRLRGADRRARARGTDRRSVSRSKRPSGRRVRSVRLAGSTGLRITVSIGVARQDEKNARPNDVIKAADQALYRAKKSGRNRVEMNGTTRTRGKRNATGSSS
jgi:diguanylate cyclase (GGDEF)-like protein